MFGYNEKIREVGVLKERILEKEKMFFEKTRCSVYNNGNSYGNNNNTYNNNNNHGNNNGNNYNNNENCAKSN